MTILWRTISFGKNYSRALSLENARVFDSQLDGTGAGLLGFQNLLLDEGLELLNYGKSPLQISKSAYRYLVRDAVGEDKIHPQKHLDLGTLGCTLTSK